MLLLCNSRIPSFSVRILVHLISKQKLHNRSFSSASSSKGAEAWDMFTITWPSATCSVCRAGLKHNLYHHFP